MRPVCLFTGLMVLMLALSGTSVSAQTKISVMLYSFPEQMGVFEEIAEALKKEMPDVELELIVPAVSEYQEKLLVMVATGTTPDVVFVHGNWMTPLIRNDAFLDLNEFIARDGYVLEDVFFPQTLSLFQRDGAVYGLPFAFIPVALRYNVDLFNNAGLEPPPSSTDEYDRWTWEHFREAARRIQRRDAEGRLMTAGMGLGAHRIEQFIFPWQAGADFLTSDHTAVAINSPEGIEGYQFAVDLMHQYDAASKLNERLPFTSGNVGMENTFQFSGDFGFEWAFTLQPWHREKATTLTLEGFAVSRTTAHPELAWNVLKFFTGEEAGLIHAAIELPRNIPPLRSADVVDAFMERHPQYELSVAMLPYARVEPGAYTEREADLNSIGTMILRRMYLGDIPVEQGVEQMKREIDPLLRR